MKNHNEQLDLLKKKITQTMQQLASEFDKLDLLVNKVYQENNESFSQDFDFLNIFENPDLNKDFWLCYKKIFPWLDELM